ncbi:MAG: hypothetical protein K2G11_06565 [Muribaculaceae bacterium]|nr:hypothetical protein [Muribaculaceae bacterium]
MKEQSTIIEVTLSQESVDAIAKAVSEVMVDFLNDNLILLREDLQEIKNNSQLGYSLKKYQRAVLR